MFLGRAETMAYGERERYITFQGSHIYVHRGKILNARSRLIQTLCAILMHNVCARQFQMKKMVPIDDHYVVWGRAEVNLLSF